MCYLAVFGHGVARVITVDRPGKINLEQGYSIEVGPIPGGVSVWFVRGGKRLTGTNLRPTGVTCDALERGYKLANFSSKTAAQKWAEEVT